jgi:hypothetical protein
MTRLQLSGAGHIVFELIALWGILILVATEILGSRLHWSPNPDPDRGAGSPYTSVASARRPCRRRRASTYSTRCCDASTATATAPASPAMTRLRKQPDAGGRPSRRSCVSSNSSGLSKRFAGRWSRASRAGCIGFGSMSRCRPRTRTASISRSIHPRRAVRYNLVEAGAVFGRLCPYNSQFDPTERCRFDPNLVAEILFSFLLYYKVYLSPCVSRLTL